MKRLSSIFLICLMQVLTVAASTFNLNVDVTPPGAASLNTSGGTYEEGQKVSLWTSVHTGFQFQGWYEGEEKVASTQSFTYTMPSHDVTLLARFVYDPDAPADPEQQGVVYSTAIEARPAGGGSFNTNGVTIKEGDNIRLYAYTNTGFRFLRWEDESGQEVSDQQNFYYVMPKGGGKLFGIFEYDPAPPANPGKNRWDKEIGNLIVDDFTPGSLYYALDEALDGSSRDAVGMITVAGVMNSNDFSIANNFSSCTLLDLSRVTGVTEIPSYAFDKTSLESVLLPSTIEKIGSRAFENCNQLAKLTVYAMTPPALESYVFRGIPEGLVVYVPGAAVSQYQDADGWKDFTILPITEDVRSLTVNLPYGADPKAYAHMWLEIRNTKSGQRIHYVMTDRNAYTFASVIRNTSWDIILRNERGDIFGTIPDVEVGDDDVTVDFASLALPLTMRLVVLTPDGKDVTDRIQVSWTDSDGNYLGLSVINQGLPEGMELGYRLTLPQDLATACMAPSETSCKVSGSAGEVKCSLVPIPVVNMSGRVKDSATGLPISDALVTASQTYVGKYTKTVTGKTDAKGGFSMKLNDVPTSLTVSSSDYVSRSLLCDSLMTGTSDIALSEIALRPISGAVVSLDFRYRKSALKDETAEEQTWYDDYANVSYTIFNKTRNKPVTQFNVQYPVIVLLEEVGDYDRLEITAKSVNDRFMPVTDIVTIDEAQRGEVCFNIMELGGLQTTFVKNTNPAVAAQLYDSKGKLCKNGGYSNSKWSVSGLKDGCYTLVTMGANQLYNSISSLGQLKQTGLVEGVDYTLDEVEVKSGLISEVRIESVPKLDESKLYYTGANSSFTVNKPSIVAGNFLTLTGKIDFKPAYAGQVSNVRLVVDLPEACDFVDNSVMVGNTVTNYLLDGRRLTVPLNTVADRVRFCIVPTLGGEYAPSAFASFDLNGETVTQPIGSANYAVKNLSISVPSTTKSVSIPVKGSAAKGAQIDVYDNNVLIGQTQSKANGQWEIMCDLTETLNFSSHTVYAKVTTKEGLELRSESMSCLYDENAIEAKSVDMSFYNGWLKRQVDVKWDLQNKSTSANSYMFYTATDITFTVEFTDNDPEMVQDVELFVFTSDGECVVLDPDFDENIEKFVATEKFTSNKLPINVSVAFNVGKRDVLDFSDAFEAEVKSLQELGKRAIAKGELIDLEIVTDEDSRTVFKTIVPGRDEEGYFEIRDLDYNTMVEQLKTTQYDFEKTENGYLYTLVEERDGSTSLTIIDKGEQVAYTLVLHDSNQSTRSLTSATRAGKKSDFFKKSANIKYLKSLYVKGNWIGTLNNLRGFVGDFLGLNQYAGCRNFNMCFDVMAAYMDEMETRAQILTDALIAQCQDGSYRLSDEDRRKFAQQISNYDAQIGLIYNSFLSYVDLYKAKLRNALWIHTLKALGGAALSKGADTGAEAISKLGRVLTNKKNAKYFKYWISSESGRGYVENVLGVAFGEIIGAIDGIINPEMADFQGVEDEMNEWMNSSRNNMADLYSAILKNMKDSYKKCTPKKKEPNPPAPPTDPINPIHDPSGYVYEAVASNRVEGVTATVFYKEMVEDMYGDLHENIVKWDAEEYAQKNPLFTDEFGMYAWDVPQGLWQVRFEKEGYETTFSEWLPVPPPQLEVNIPIRQNVQPNVKSARAFEDAVELEFDKYMLPETLTSENVMVLVDDKPLTGTVTLINEEESYENSGESFASKVRFTATEPFPAEEVTLLVKNRVKSYADVRMQNDYMQKFGVELEVRRIECDSVVDVAYGGSRVITVSVLPGAAAAGKKLNVNVASVMTISTDTESVELDENGCAEILVSGDLPGVGALQFSVEGYDISTFTLVNVRKDFNKVATPTVNIASGSTLEKGTEVYLTCDTEDARIYYTLDGSCPCDDTDARKEYDGSPIIVNEDVTIKAMAYAPDMYESEIATYVYYAADSGVDTVGMDNSVRLYPLPMRETLNISAGDGVLKRVAFTSMTGTSIVIDLDGGTQASVDTSRLPAGVYMVTVETDRGNVVRKLVKTN